VGIARDSLFTKAPPGMKKARGAAFSAEDELSLLLWNIADEISDDTEFEQLELMRLLSRVIQPDYDGGNWEFELQWREDEEYDL